ncbi:MAG: alkaline phosphatase family protein, partial [Longispora sp.]|nr:alkaline phosphatase family protein [Longispora sp. (in: high G+C Gram-positive bacteria)]
SHDPDPALWQPLPTRFEVTGLSTEVFGPGAFAGSGLTVSAYRGATYTPSTLEELPTAMQASRAQLMYAYHSRVDHAGHLFGLGSSEWLAEVTAVDRTLERLLSTVDDDTAIVVTADHGMLNFAPEDKVDFNSIPALREGVRLLAGEPRVRYLHTSPGAVADVVDTWRELLARESPESNSLILTRDEVIDGGWFGPVRSEHAARIGDVVVICRGRQLVVSTVQEARGSALVGYHGSDSREELGIPLVVIPPR